MMIWQMHAACRRGVKTFRRACAVRRRWNACLRPPAGNYGDPPSCTIALVGITQATGVLTFDFRSR